MPRGGDSRLAMSTVSQYMLTTCPHCGREFEGDVRRARSLMRLHLRLHGERLVRAEPRAEFPLSYQQVDREVREEKKLRASNLARLEK